MIRTTLAAACGLVLMATASYAATIDVREIKKQTTVMLIYTAVIITGDIELGDDAKLLAILEADPRIAGNNNAIILNSPGGLVLPGVRMGEMIKWRGLATWVANGNVCSSVCAAMWLAGSIRYAAGSARIGFHAAFQGTLGQPTTYKRSAPGSAAMQEYYGRIGAGDRDVSGQRRRSERDVLADGFDCEAARHRVAAAEYESGTCAVSCLVQAKHLLLSHAKMRGRPLATSPECWRSIKQRGHQHGRQRHGIGPRSRDLSVLGRGIAFPTARRCGCSARSSRGPG
jgi:ATP-dependent protease ClpP protease subunit